MCMDKMYTSWVMHDLSWASSVIVVDEWMVNQDKRYSWLIKNVTKGSEVGTFGTQ